MGAQATASAIATASAVATATATSSATATTCPAKAGRYMWRGRRRCVGFGLGNIGESTGQSTGAQKKRRGKFLPRLFAVRPELFAAAIYSATVGSRSFFRSARPERV